MVERPLASGRPLTVQLQGNAFGARGLEGFRNQQQKDGNKNLFSSPIKPPEKLNISPQSSSSPVKAQSSPIKSSLSSKSRYAPAQMYEPASEIWSDDEEAVAERQLPPGKSLHRHAKSVTFDAAPPQVNEYEMTTPDPSSVASGSREGSYDSCDNEEDSFERDSSIDHDDSFDASLEDTQKTPVVLPEDWRFMSPEAANIDLAAHVDDSFNEQHSSPAPIAASNLTIGASSPSRTNSVNSNGDSRPLPPLPGLGMPVIPHAPSSSNSNSSTIAEGISSAQSTVPSHLQPASVSESEIYGRGGCSMSIEDRLRLMMIQDEETSISPTGNPILDKNVHEVDWQATQTRASDGIQIYEDEMEDDGADLGEYKLPPRISRESILRKVKSKRQMLDSLGEEFSNNHAEQNGSARRELIADIDPDTPLPSLETEALSSEGGNGDGVFIKQEDDEQSEVDVYAIPDLYSQYLQPDAYNDEKTAEYGSDNETLHELEDDDRSH